MQQMRGYLTPAEVARLLGVSVEMVRTWLKAGRIEHVRTPLGRLIPAAEVDRLAAERRQRGCERRGAMSTKPAGQHSDD